MCCVLSYFSHVWLSVILWTAVCQALLSTGFSRREYWTGLPCPPPGDLPDPGIELMSPAQAGGFLGSLPLAPSGKPIIWWLSDKQFACQCRRCEFDPWVWNIPWRRKCQTTPAFMPGKFHGQRSLASYSPRGAKSWTWLSTHTWHMNY